MLHASRHESETRFLLGGSGNRSGPQLVFQYGACLQVSSKVHAVFAIHLAVVLVHAHALAEAHCRSHSPCLFFGADSVFCNEFVEG